MSAPTFLELPGARDYLTKRQLAERLHVSVSTIKRWMLAGMPHEKWGPKILRFDTAKVLQWAREHGRMAA